jgi:hypothetical protein
MKDLTMDEKRAKMRETSKLGSNIHSDIVLRVISECAKHNLGPMPMYLYLIGRLMSEVAAIRFSRKPDTPEVREELYRMIEGMINMSIEGGANLHKLMQKLDSNDNPAIKTILDSLRQSLEKVAEVSPDDPNLAKFLRDIEDSQLIKE